MDVHSLDKYPQKSLDTLLASIPFYKAVKQADRFQYEILMSHSKIIEFESGEVVLEKGQKDEWLYFLLKGQLEVLVGDGNCPDTVANYITPGEVFGDLSVLLDHIRTATVIADPNSKKVLVFGTDFKIFGELDNFRPITLNTKLIYYRNMVHNLRWKLEVYRVTYPDEEFASDHRKVKLYSGKKDCLDELVSLDDQAHQLALMLIHWNAELGRIGVSPPAKIDVKSLTSLHSS